MSAIFIYHTTDCLFFLYVLSKEKAKILSKATVTNSHCPQQGSPPPLPDLPLISWEWSDETDPRRKLSHLHYSCSQTSGDTIMDVWKRYLFFWKCNKDPPKPLDSTSGISAAGLISLQVFFFSFYLQSRRGKSFTLPLFTADLQITEAGK